MFSILETSEFLKITETSIHDPTLSSINARGVTKAPVDIVMNGCPSEMSPPGLQLTTVRLLDQTFFRCLVIKLVFTFQTLCVAIGRLHACLKLERQTLVRRDLRQSQIRFIRAYLRSTLSSWWLQAL